MSYVFDGVFFFKQKTAYEMRISDWSSDVCSSDLMPEWVMSMERISQRTAISLFVTAAVRADEDLHERLLGRDGLIASWFGPEGMSADRADRSPAIREAVRTRLQRLLDGQLIEADERLGGRCLITGEPVDAGRKIAGEDELYGKIGRASCRERVCQYV